MPAVPAIIFIPDISGYTKFMSSLELEHASHIISTFLKTIVDHAENKFEVSEIEGDAVLLFKKDSIMSRQEMVDQCIDIFKAFHFQRKSMQQVVLCHCGACQSIINLSLKFIVHAGIISEIKVNRFSKPSGVDMIIAHRLLKNSIGEEEYILVTDNFLNQSTPQTDTNLSELQWQSAEEEFPSLGKVAFQFALLKSLRSTIPDPPKYEIEYDDQQKVIFDLEISAHYKDVFMILIDISGRTRWMSNLDKVTTEQHHPSIGTVHTCFFGDVVALVTPATVTHHADEIYYAETLTVELSDIYTVYDFRFAPLGERCRLSARILALEGKELSEAKHTFLFDGLKQTCQDLKAFCEQAIR